MSEQSVGAVKRVYAAFAEGDVAALHRHTGKASGKPLDIPVVHVWDIQDGKACAFPSIRRHGEVR
jgi:ketosteroid isomerase-like protein